MRKNLLLTVMMCLVPFLGNAQVKSAGIAGTPTSQTEVTKTQTLEDQKIEEAARSAASVNAKSKRYPVQPNFDKAAMNDMCTYIVNCYDSYGDGWNGAALIITSEDGTELGVATIESGDFVAVEIAVPTGTANLVWQSGSYDSECSFDVYYPWGEIMVVYDEAPESGIFYTWTNTCGSAPAAPTNFVATQANDELVVELSWTNPSTTIGGADLTDLYIVLERNGEVIQEFNPAEVGAISTYTDNSISTEGFYEYTLVAFNAEGQGGSVKTSLILGPSCTYTVICYDDYGDGWDGRETMLFTNEAGVELASVSMVDGTEVYFDVTLPTGVINMVWVQGPEDSEGVTFEVLYPWNEVMLFVDDESIDYGIFYTWTNDCNAPSCVIPTDVTAIEVLSNEATLTWTENGDATTWEIEYGPQGFSYGEGTVVEATANPFTLTGLEQGTHYDVYVRSVCSSDDVSSRSRKAYFITPITCGEDVTSLTATIGDGTTPTRRIPLNVNYRYSYVQELYTAEELAAQGVTYGEIHTIAFQHYAERVRDISVKILLSNVDLADLSAGWYINENNMELVYDGIYTLTQEEGFNAEFAFQTPFLYDGISDIVVTFIYGWDSYTGRDDRYYTHSTNSVMALRCENDDVPYGLYEPFGERTDMTERNNLQFRMCLLESENVAVSGQVTSSYTNEPVAGATVTFNGVLGSTVTTDANGEYTIGLVKLNDYNVTITAEGFNTYTENISVPDSETATFDFAIAQPAIELSDSDVIIETSFMNQGAYEMTIANNGTGELSWSVDIETEEGAKSLESVAHVVIGSTEMYNFTLGDPAGATPAGFSFNGDFLNGTVYVDGVTYFAESTSNTFGIIDYEAGAIDVLGSLGNSIGNVTYNPVTGEVVVMQLVANPTFYTINPSTLEMTELVTATTSDLILAGTFSSDGRLFVVDAGQDGIVEVDLATGATTLVWSGFSVNYGQDVEWDFEDDLLYWAAYNYDNGQAQLYAVDVNAGEGTLIGTFIDQASGLTIETAAYSWLKAEPKKGTIAAGETATFNLVADGWYAESGTFNAVATVSSNTVTPSIDVPVTFIINPPACDPVTNPAVEVTDFNDIHITWGAPENADGVVAYAIYNYDEKVPFAQVDPSEFEYNLDDQEPGNYGFRVRAMYEDGCISVSGDLLECTTTEAIGTVFGTVTDSYTGEAIVGATVKLSGAYITTTDENGEYYIEVVVGTYENVKVSADSYNSLTIESLEVAIYDNPMDFVLVSKFLPVENLTGEYADGAVTLTWEAPAAKGTKEDVVLYESFDAPTTPEDWTIVDADGDGFIWSTISELGLGSTPYMGDDAMISGSYDANSGTPLTPDNWMITPAIPVNGGTITYYVCAQDASYPAEHYGVYYSLDGTDPSSFELLFEETLTAKSEGAMAVETIGKDGAKDMGTWYERVIELDGINAAEVYLAFRHHDVTDMFYMLIDEVTVVSNPPVAAEPTDYIVERNGEELAIVSADQLTYIDNTAESGTYTYCVTAVYNNILSAPACVEVECGLLGDANGDGIVNVGDVTTIIAYIFNMNPPTFVFANADVNGDGSINVNDIQGVVAIVYGAKGTCEVPNVQYQISNGVLYMNNDAPVAAFQIALSNSNVKALAFDEFITATGTTEDGYVFLAYNFDGKVFEAGTHALLQVNDAEVNYFLTSTACGDAAEGVENAFLGIEENNFSAAYPNPFSTFVTVNNSANAEFVVTSITGQVVYKETTSSNFVWTPANVNSGVYFINVYVDGVNVQTEKVVYQK